MYKNQENIRLTTAKKKTKKNHRKRIMREYSKEKIPRNANTLGNQTKYWKKKKREKPNSRKGPETTIF